MSSGLDIILLVNEISPIEGGTSMQLVNSFSVAKLFFLSAPERRRGLLTPQLSFF
jgi:hypothetical protein